MEKSRGPPGGGWASEMGRTGWVGRRGDEMTMRRKDEEQGHAVVQSRR